MDEEMFPPLFPCHEYLKNHGGIFEEAIFKAHLMENQAQLFIKDDSNNTLFSLLVEGVETEALRVFLEVIEILNLINDFKFSLEPPCAVNSFENVLYTKNFEFIQVFLQFCQRTKIIDVSKTFFYNISSRPVSAFDFVRGLHLSLLHTLKLFNYFLELGFPVPELLTRTIIILTFNADKMKRNNNARKDGDSSEALLEFSNVLQFAKSALDLVRVAAFEKSQNHSLFLKCGISVNSLQKCVMTNQHELLEYFLQTLSSKHPEKLVEVLRDTAQLGINALFCCVYPALFAPMNPQRNRIECFKLFIKYGQSVNEFAAHASLTPLHYTIIVEQNSKVQIEMARYLLENGADIFLKGEDEGSTSALDMAVYFAQEEFLLSAMELKLFSPHSTSQTKFKTSHLSNLLTSASGRYKASLGPPQFPFNFEQEAEKVLRIVEAMRKYGCKLLKTDLNTLLAFHRDKMGNFFFTRLLQTDVDLVGEDFSHFDILSNAVSMDAFAHFKLLLDAKAPLKIPNYIGACNESRRHRKVSHQNLIEKHKFFGLRSSSLGDFTICDVCSRQIPGEDFVLTCEVLTCNADVCARCAFFQHEGPLYLLDVAVRKNDPKYISLLNFLLNSKVGRRIYKSKLSHCAETLLNSKIIDLKLIDAMTEINFRDLGLNSYDFNKLLAVFDKIDF